MYIHRFKEASAAGVYDGQDGQWLGRVKMLTDKQNKIMDELKDMRKSTDESLAEIREQMNE